MRIIAFTFAFILSLFRGLYAQPTEYSHYHKTVLKIEELTAKENYEQALDLMDGLCSSYTYVFLKDYKVAAQLAVQIKDFERAFDYLQLGISLGWTLKEIKKTPALKPLIAMAGWNRIKSEYDALRSDYEGRINQEIRAVVRKMYKKDQKFAIKYLFKLGQKAKERYGNKKGVTHTRQQIAQLQDILGANGYPGEKLIGESEWMSTILSHHNSVSKEFVVQDTLFPQLRPKLLEAISNGEMNPYDLAFIEDWYIAVKSDRKDAGYGYLDRPTKEEITTSNALREKLNIRSIELRNGLVDVQEKTGINFYLAGYPWVDGKIVPFE